ncbi:TPA: RNA-directed DNA polymerase [Vibrio vulnificus]|nr:RNA-directed DNA polymerase [Vibrio vulnificus]
MSSTGYAFKIVIHFNLSINIGLALLIKIQKQRTLKEVFKSTFHDKISFKEFINLNLDEEYTISTFKKKKIYSPSDKLKKIHRFINSSILEHADFNREVVYSYLKGSSVRDAVELHSQSQYFFKTDIHNFFGIITTRNIKKSLEEQFSNVPISDIDMYKEFLFKLMVIDDVLPVGFSTSPLLSNICLFEFDNHLQAYCSSNNFKYTRYSDDIVISSNKSFDIEEMSENIQALLSKHVNEGAKLNKSKTKVHSKGERINILGYNILPNDEITISSKDKKETEILLHFYLNDLDKFDDYVTKNIINRFRNSDKKSIRDIGLSSLSGRIIGINTMDKKYLIKLRKKYGNTLIDMLLRKTV